MTTIAEPELPATFTFAEAESRGLSRRRLRMPAIIIIIIIIIILLPAGFFAGAHTADVNPQRLLGAA